MFISIFVYKFLRSSKYTFKFLTRLIPLTYSHLVKESGLLMIASGSLDLQIISYQHNFLIQSTQSIEIFPSALSTCAARTEHL